LLTNPRSLRQPEERVGKCSNAALPPPASPDTDLVLVQRARMHDEVAVRALHERYAQALHHLAQHFVRRPEDAEEVVQETWIAALSGIHGFREKSSFRTWLFAILVNRARSRARRDARSTAFSALPHAEQVRISNVSGDGSALVAPQRATDHLALNNELQIILARAIDALPELQKLVLTLRDVEGFSADEVCDMLQLTHGNQRVLLHRARMKVRSDLIPYLQTGASNRAVSPAGSTVLEAGREV
jgi:RNA polymerase sigma-70 factor (ECF subfamily)